MRFSEQWLREWVSPDQTTDGLVEQLTMAGLEVDSVTQAASDFSGVVVGLVLSAEQHPDADRLRVCRVDVGKNVLDIVCGAPNVRIGLKVAVILVGGVLPDGTKVKKAKLRGMPSQGMICSSRELGLSEEHNGILELSADAPIGEDFRLYYGLNDAVIDVELTPNRGDCASVQGIAREVAALNQLPLKPPVFKAIPAVVQDKFAIDLDAPEACPRYIGRVIRGIDAQAVTPVWMQEKLRRSGLRSIHPVVDITNYVMLELGQPLHAFDYGLCKGGIRIRFAKAGESMTLLDGQAIECDESMLVIADHEKPLALAGVMGGAESAVTDSTQDILLESAYFAPSGIALTARRLGIQTDSSYRFERGVDFNVQAMAIERATDLLLEIAGGQPGPLNEVSSDAHSPAREPILLRRESIPRLLGMHLEDAAIENNLKALGLLLEPQESGWFVTPPSYRFDIASEVDLIEEVARLHGYNNIPTQTLVGDLRVPVQVEPAAPVQRLMHYFMDRGYHEAITYSFVDPAIQAALDPDREAIRLSNPLANDMSVMRTSLWAGLLQALQYNQRRQQARVRLFEVGLCFHQQDAGYDQTPMLGGVVSGHARPLQWGETDRRLDFYDVKADIEGMLALTGRHTGFEWKKGSHPALHPGQTAELVLGGESVGYLGALHPQLLKQLDVSEAYLFEFRLSALVEGELPRYQPISKFPAVRRDLAFVVDECLEVEEICKKIKAFSGQLLNMIEIFDIYQGESIGLGKKSVALGLTFQDPSRTLVDDEINKVIHRVVAGLDQELDAKLRA